MRTEFIRVTQIPLLKPDYAILSGVPLMMGSSHRKSTKYKVSVIINAEMLPVQPVIGQHWKVQGEPKFETFENNGFRYKQHTFDQPQHIECVMPESGESFISFVASDEEFKGIGTSKARDLWEKFGSNLYAILQEDTTDNRERFSNILSDASIAALFNGYKKYRNLKYAHWLSEIGVPFSIHKRLFKLHNEQSIDHITKNPYLLLSFGMAFPTVDTIAYTHFQIEKYDSRRLSAALEASIQEEVGKGHTFTHQTDLKPHLMKLLDDRELVAQAFVTGFEIAQFHLNPTTFTYHPSGILFMETVVAKRLTALAQEKDLFDADASNAYLNAVSKLPYKLTDKQLKAVITTLNHNVSCITGGAGTGKTTVLKTALNAFKKLGYIIHAVALSGRATMRLHESIGIETSTIAAMLHSAPIEPKNEDEKHVLVIDEASMVDIPTIYQITTHLHPTVRIIFSGDPNQLPPIGCGKVLSDIITSGVVANTTLDIVKRQEGSTGIPEYSSSVNQGKIPINISTGNITFHDVSDSEVIETCRHLYAIAPESSRVMAPTKKLVREINLACQASINPDGLKIQFELNGDLFFIDLRLNDIILFNKNNYELGFQNGSLGKLVSVNCNDTILGQVQLDTGIVVDITQEVLDCMELGYAITLHKAQGSQFPCVIVALKKGRIMDRAWLYTAITRAEKDIHIVGSQKEFIRAVQTISQSDKRNSFLSNLIIDLAKNY